MSALSKLLYRFDLVNPHWDHRVGYILVALWVVIVLCAISSIKTQGFGEARERFWIIVVTAVPIIGVLAYLPFSVKKDDLPHYFRFKPRDRATIARASVKSEKSLTQR